MIGTSTSQAPAPAEAGAAPAAAAAAPAQGEKCLGKPHKWTTENNPQENIFC